MDLGDQLVWFAGDDYAALALLLWWFVGSGRT
jgi:hypothetical protein